jgi:hypothetical protein
LLSGYFCVCRAAQLLLEQDSLRWAAAIEDSVNVDPGRIDTSGADDFGQFPARRLALRQAPVPVQRDAIHPYKYFRVIPQLMKPFPSSDPRALRGLHRIFLLGTSGQKKSNGDIKSFLIGKAIPFTRHAFLDVMTNILLVITGLLQTLITGQFECRISE